MNTLGTDQLLAMKFGRLPLSDEWREVMGNLPEVFMIIVYGESGEGKTEGCIRLAKELARFGDVKWLAYETGHAADIQDAVERNNMRGLPVAWVNPWKEKDRDKKAIDSFVPPRGMPMNKDEMANRLFIALYIEMSKKKSAKYWFIDSADAMDMTKKQMLWLRSQFVERKGIIYIAHGEGKKPKSELSKAIEFYSQAGFLVKNYRWQAEKNRFKGFKPYIIWEERARELDPVWFEMNETPTPKGEPAKKKKKKKIEADLIEE